MIPQIITADDIATAPELAAGTAGRVVDAALIKPVLAAVAARFDVRDYGASGLKATTTGAITSGTAELVVASASGYAVGQGILVKGAGVAGVHLVSTISAIVGTTITLEDNASSTVSGAVVQHDDSDAINAACDAAYSAGGGEVFLGKTGCDGFYRCNKLRSATNSIIGFPSALPSEYDFEAKRCFIIGESQGYMSLDMTQAFGTCIDSTDLAFVPSGTFPAVIASHVFGLTEFNSIGCGFCDVNLEVNNLLILVRPRALKSICGINAFNSQQLIVGDNVSIVNMWLGSVPPFSGWGSTGPSDPNNPSGNDSWGIVSPGPVNYRKSRIGRASIMGFFGGIHASEHLDLGKTIITYCTYGIFIYQGPHPITGTASIENVNYCVVVGPTASTPVSLTLAIENGATGPSPSAWWTPVWTVFRIGGGYIRGNISYSAYTAGTTDPVEATVSETGVFVDLSLFNLNKGRMLTGLDTVSADNIYARPVANYAALAAFAPTASDAAGSVAVPFGALSDANPQWWCGHRQGAHGPLSFWTYNGSVHSAVKMTLSVNGLLSSVGGSSSTVFTVATLPPSPVSGQWASVSDALAPTYGVAVVGDGAVTTPVFYDGTNWTCR